MLELILVRHGETDSNIRGAYCGWTDCELNEKGRAQAQKAAEMLKSEKLSAIYSSPLKRAHSTSSIINENHNIDIVLDERLKEQNFGEWEDLAYCDIVERYPEDCANWQKDWMNYCIKDGESSVKVYQRISGFIDSILKTNINGTILIVTHLGCIRMILAQMLGMSIEGFWRFRVDNGSVSRLVIDDGYAYLKLLNA